MQNTFATLHFVLQVIMHINIYGHLCRGEDITQHFSTGCKSCELRPEMAPGLAELFVSFSDLLAYLPNKV